MGRFVLVREACVLQTNNRARAETAVKGCKVTQMGFPYPRFFEKSANFPKLSIPLLNPPFQGGSNDIQHVIDRENLSELPYTLYRPGGRAPSAARRTRPGQTSVYGMGNEIFVIQK